MHDIYIVKDGSLVEIVKIRHEPIRFILYRGLLYEMTDEKIDGDPVYKQRQYLELY